MTGALYCAAVLVTSNSNCCSVEGLCSHVSPLINTELTATSFHLTEWSIPRTVWRTQELTLSPQILSLSPQALWPSSWSCKCSDKNMIPHQFPTRQHFQLCFDAAPTWWTHFLLNSLCNLFAWITFYHPLADVGIIVLEVKSLSGVLKVSHKTITAMLCCWSEVISVMFSLLSSQRSLYSHHN